MVFDQQGQEKSQDESQEHNKLVGTMVDPLYKIDNNNTSTDDK